MSRHPCAGLSRAQRDAFEALCMGEQPDCSPEVLDALVERKLIDRVKPLFDAKAWPGPPLPPRYEVPIRHHAAWCEWLRAQQKKG